MKDQSNIVIDENAKGLCQFCGKKPAHIHVEGQGDFCKNCYNSRELQKMGIPDTFQYKEKVSIAGPDRKRHKFILSHLIFGNIVSWEAEEEGSGRKIRFYSRVDQDGSWAVEVFLEKIRQVIKTQTFEQHEFKDEFGELQTSRRYIKSKGNINIIENENDYEKILFEIDGEVVEPQELEDLLTPYAGFQLQYTIRDSAEPILGEDIYLVPVEITEETLSDELETAINVHTDRGGFLSYRNVMAFDQAVYPILDKLKVLAGSKKRDSAIRAGKTMMRRLSEIEHDDDFFPAYHLDYIAQVIDPQGIDKGVQKLRMEE